MMVAVFGTMLAAMLLAYALKMAVLGADPSRIAPLPWVVAAGRVLGLMLIALCAVNFAAVVLQCGVGQCHTFGYQLLT